MGHPEPIFKHNVTLRRSPAILLSLQVMCALHNAHTSHMLFSIVRILHFIFCLNSQRLSIFSCSIFLVFLSFRFVFFLCHYCRYSLAFAQDYTSTEIISYLINENYMESEKRDDTHTHTRSQNGMVEFRLLQKINTYAQVSSSGNASYEKTTMLHLTCMRVRDFRCYF